MDFTPQILVPRRNILEYGKQVDVGIIVTLDNYLTTDVYLDDLNNYRSITNDKSIISHLNYYGFEMVCDRIILLSTNFKVENNGYKRLTFSLYIPQFDESLEMEIYFNNDENIAISYFLTYNESLINYHNLREIEYAINYFVFTIEEITRSNFLVEDDEKILIDYLNHEGYNISKSISVDGDLKSKNQYYLEKELTY